jgi:purine-binding chemotaxis protein CheW
MSTAQQFVDQEIAGNAPVGTDQYLTFIVADEEYGVDILRVQEIKGWDKVTPIPNTPDYVQGVINLRGTIVPVVDLRQRFAMPKLDYGPTTVVIVLKVAGEDRDRTMGIIVDAVSDVYDVDPNDVKPPPDLGGDMGSEWVKGLATVDEKMVIVLDIDQMLAATGETHLPGGDGSPVDV